MKKICIYFSLSLLFLMTSCSSLQNVKLDKKQIAYSLGRLTTIGYMYEKDKLSDEKRDIIIKIWIVFDNSLMIIDENNVDKIKLIMKKDLAKLIKDPIQFKIACFLIDKYFNKLQSKFDLQKYTNKEIYIILKAYHDGIKNAILDYQL